MNDKNSLKDNDVIYRRRAFKAAWDSIFVYQHAGYLTTDDILVMLDGLLEHHPDAINRFEPLREIAVRRLSMYQSPTPEGGGISQVAFINRIEGVKPFNGQIINFLHDFREFRNYWEEYIPEHVLNLARQVTTVHPSALSF